MNKFILILFLLVFVWKTQAQNGLFKSADELYVSGYYYEAIELFNRDLKKCKDCKSIQLSLAMSFYKIHDYNSSFNYFQKVGDKNNWETEFYQAYLVVANVKGELDAVKEELKNETNVNFKINAVDSTLLEEFPLFKIKPLEVNIGRSFSGVTVFNNDLLIATPNDKKGGITQSYKIYSFNKSNLESKGLFKSFKDKSVFYQGNPFCYRDSLLFYVESNTGEKWYNSKNKLKKNFSVNGDNFLSIRMFKFSDEKFYNLNNLNDEGCNNVTPFYTVLNGKEILLFASDRKGAKTSYDLFYSVINKQGNWSVPKEIVGVNTRFSEVYPYVKKGVLYFSSKGNDNFGGLDVFKADFKLEDDQLIVNKVENVGQGINSKYDDFGLSWNSDTSGFVGSNREGESGEDRVYEFRFSEDVTLNGQVVDLRDEKLEGTIYSYELSKENEWLLIDTAGFSKGVYQLNLKRNKDFKIVFVSEGLDSTEVLYKKNAKTDSLSDFDIIVLKDIVIYGELKDAITEKAIPGAKINIYEVQNGEKILVSQQVVDENGNWDFAFKRDTEYEIEIEKRDYDKVVFEISRDSRQRQFDLGAIKSIKLSPEVKEDAVIRIDNIYFDYNSADITKESFGILENLISFLTINPDVKIELSAHTDCVGSDKYNQKLSQKRAESCYKFLVNKGIYQSRLTPKGYGEKYILNGCVKDNQCTEEENKINRRIEVKVLSK